MLKKLFTSLFSIGKWKTVYFTQNIEQYFAIKGKLLNHNIKFKTKIINNSRGSKGGRGSLGCFGNLTNYYEILVNTEDVHKANQIIHHS